MLNTILQLYTLLTNLGWKLLLPLGTLLLPIKAVLVCVGLVICIDTGFGIWAATKTKIPLTSSRLSAVISKMLIYQVAICTIFFIETVLLTDFLRLVIGIPLVATKFVALVLISVEVYSVDEKLKAVNSVGLWFYTKRILNLAKFLKREVTTLKDKN